MITQKAKKVKGFFKKCLKNINGKIKICYHLTAYHLLPQNARFSQSFSAGVAGDGVYGAPLSVQKDWAIFL